MGIKRVEKIKNVNVNIWKELSKKSRSVKINNFLKSGLSEVKEDSWDEQLAQRLVDCNI